jgi:hypothetical protein
MLQIFSAVFETCYKFAHDNWVWIVLGVLVFSGGGFALRVAAGLLQSRGPEGR